jgi:hypothetical protein
MPDPSDAAGSPAPQPADDFSKPISFDPRMLDRTVIARPLLQELKKKGEDALVDVVIDLNLNFPGGRDHARERVRDLAIAAMAAAAVSRAPVSTIARRS